MELKKHLVGRIFDIQGFSVHDGPGARSVIFMKGCSLHCFWCSNPEGISFSKLPMYHAPLCISCGNCIAACTHQALQLQYDKLKIDRMFCKQCNEQPCVDHCFTDALRMSGRDVSIEELFKIIQRDRQYWGKDGGVTLSGGEPLIQIHFVSELLKKCYDAYIHTAIETCGQVPWEHFKITIPFIDWIFFDIKHMNTCIHQTGTSSDNSLILSNIKKLNETFQGKLVFRMPFIPGFNNDIENMAAIADLILSTKWKEINLLPLHHLGREKYALLGQEYEGIHYQTPSQQELLEAKTFFKSKDIRCYIGAEMS